MKIKIKIDDEEKIVDKKDYIKAKHKQLKEFGYTSLTEDEVAKQLEKVILKEKLNVIGMWMENEVLGKEIK